VWEGPPTFPYAGLPGFPNQALKLSLFLGFGAGPQDHPAGQPRYRQGQSEKDPQGRDPVLQERHRPQVNPLVKRAFMGLTQQCFSQVVKEQAPLPTALWSSR
jgi:hypothetical protein